MSTDPQALVALKQAIEDAEALARLEAKDREPIIRRAVEQIMRGFSWETLQGPENLRARLSLCARQAVCDADAADRDDAEHIAAQLRASLAREEALRGANEAAMLRLGALGLSAEMPADLAALCAKLGTMGSYGHKGYPTHYLNPDGKEAAAAIERLNTRAAALERRLEVARGVVSYYAENDHYDCGDVPGHIYILDDHGRMARTFLKDTAK